MQSHALYISCFFNINFVVATEYFYNNIFQIYGMLVVLQIEVCILKLWFIIILYVLPLHTMLWCLCTDIVHMCTHTRILNMSMNIFHILHNYNII